MLEVVHPAQIKPQALRPVFGQGLEVGVEEEVIIGGEVVHGARSNPEHLFTPAGNVQAYCWGPAVSVASSKFRSSSTTTVMLVVADSPLLFVAVSVMAFVPTGSVVTDCRSPVPVPNVPF